MTQVATIHPTAVSSEDAAAAARASYWRGFNHGLVVGAAALLLGQIGFGIWAAWTERPQPAAGCALEECTAEVRP